MVIEALKAARDFIEHDRQVLAESLTVNGEIVFENDTDRRAMAEYVKVLGVIDESLKVAVRPNDHCEEHLDMVKKRPAPVREPEALLKEVDVLMLAGAHGIDPSTKGLYGFYIDCISTSPYYHEDDFARAITKTVEENLHLVRALGPNDPNREAPLTRQELRAMWIGRETGWDFYVNVDARLFGGKDTTINPQKDTNV
jgi:hypothetical protein